MAKKHSFLKLIAASVLAAVIAGITAFIFRRKRSQMDDDFDDFDDFDDCDDIPDAETPADLKTEAAPEEAAEDYESWDTPEA